MSEQLHTPEPWELFGYAIHKGGECLAYLNGCSLANARRIVACVNALEGIPTAILEMAGTGLMSEAAVEVGKLTAQRDSLLSALRALYGWQRAEVEHFGATTPDDFIIEMVEKALKSAEGK